MITKYISYFLPNFNIYLDKGPIAVVNLHLLLELLYCPLPKTKKKRRGALLLLFKLAYERFLIAVNIEI